MQLKFKLAATLGPLAFVAANLAHAAPSFINYLAISGDQTDKSGLAAGLDSRLSFGSDLFYDTASNSYYGLADRGPGGGLLPYQTRVQQFGLSVNATTGQISNFQVQSTVLFKDSTGSALNGMNPQLLNGRASTLGNSFDPEGIVRLSNGNFIVADEYGPSLREFDASGRQLRVFTTPANLVPTTATGPDFVAGRGTITSGRQDNRGFEGLTLSADGKTLVAALQAPLVNEGASNDGRRSTNVRLVEFNLASGASTRQVVYQLEGIADINSRIPGTSADFSATNQGRSIGLSAIRALPDGRFLVLERDNRGLGIDDTNAATGVGTKRIYIIDPRGATDVSNISLAGSNSLPAGVVPVQKILYLDIAAALAAAGVTIAEKIEGMDFGPQLADGSWVLLLTSDNDFSVTQTGSGEQLNVCIDPTLNAVGVTTSLSGTCNTGKSLIPSYIYAFAVNDLNPNAVPLPGTLLLLAPALAFISSRRFARKS